MEAFEFSRRVPVPTVTAFLFQCFTSYKTKNEPYLTSLLQVMHNITSPDKLTIFCDHLGSCTSTYNDFLPPVCIQRHLHGVTDQLINQDVIQWYILWLQVSVPCETSKLNTEMP